LLLPMFRLQIQFSHLPYFSFSLFSLCNVLYNTYICPLLIEAKNFQLILNSIFSNAIKLSTTENP
jgi:hypothetical protein